MNNGQIMLERLRNQVSEQDNKYNTYKVLKSDVSRLLSDYTDSTAEEVELEVKMDEKGRYLITVRATSRILNRAGSILPDL